MVGGRTIVPWPELMLKLTTVHEVCSAEEGMALKKTMVRDKR